MLTSNNAFLKFVGFGGLALIVTTAITVGRYEQQLESISMQLKVLPEMQKEIAAMSDNKDRLNRLERRIDMMEAK